MFTENSLVARLQQYMPILRWLPEYQRAWLRADFIAGVTVWAVMVPEAMAYAGIAGVPPLVGLYTVPIPLIAYAVFGTSRTMVIGPDSATALVSAGTVAAVIATQTGASQISEYLAITSALALIVGVIFLVLGLARMGWVANFIPVPVMKGFIQGLVWVTIAGQLHTLLGIEAQQGNFFQKLWAMIPEMADAKLIIMAVGLASLATLALMKTFIPRLPSALSIVILSIILVSVFDLQAYGVEVVGSVKPGLPVLSMPDFTLQQVQLLIPGALAIVLLGFAETLGAAKAAAARNGGMVDPDQELISHGPANIGSALSGGFVVVGSLSKTSVSMEAGGKTQLASLIHAFLIVMTLLFLLPLFENLPHAVLAAIVIEAMLGLLDFTYLKKLWMQSRWELLVAMVAYLGVMVVGVLPGMGLGIALSLLLLIYRASQPYSTVLAPDKARNVFHDILRVHGLKQIPGLLIFRFDASLFFASARNFHNALLAQIDQSKQPVIQVLIDAEGVNSIDSSSTEMLLDLLNDLNNKNISVAFSRVHDAVKARMWLAGIVDRVGEARFYDTLQEGVDTYLKDGQGSAD